MKKTLLFLRYQRLSKLYGKLKRRLERAMRSKRFFSLSGREQSRLLNRLSDISEKIDFLKLAIRTGGSALVVAAMLNANPALAQTQITSGGTYTFPSSDYLSDGNKVVVYGDQSAARDVFATITDSYGYPLVNQFQLNQYNTGAQQMPNVASLPAGGFVVVWAGQSATDTYGITAAIFDNGGSFITEFQVNETLVGNQNVPDVAVDGFGNIIIAWEATGTNGADVFYRIFDSSGNPLTSETQANNYDNLFQGRAKVAADDAGDFIITWQSQGIDADGNAVVGRIFDLSGTPKTNDILINTTTQGYQTNQSVTMDADGDIVVSWDSYLLNAKKSGLMYRRFDVTGTPKDQQEVLVDSLNAYVFSYTYNTSTSVDMDDDGDFVLTWININGSNYEINGQRFLNTGQPEKERFQINTYSQYNYSPSVAMDAAGDFTITFNTWVDYSNQHVLTQSFGAIQPLTNASRINDYVYDWQNRPSVAADSLGDFIVVWSTYDSDYKNNIMGQLFNPDGKPISGNFSIAIENGYQHEPSVAMDSDGDFIVVYQNDNNADSDGYGITGKRFDKFGKQIGSQFLINSYETGQQTNAKIAMRKDGGFVVVWQADHDGDINGIYGRLFDANANPLGNEFSVNSSTAGNQFGPAVEMDALGNFVVTWTDEGGVDGDGQGIIAQRFDKNGNKIGAEFTVNSSTTGNQYSPDVAMDDDGDFMIVWTDNYNNVVNWQKYDPQGNPVGPETPFTTGSAYQPDFPSVAMDGQGNYSVSYSDGATIYRLFDKYGNEKTESGSQYIMGRSTYIIASVMDNDGDLLLAWEGTQSMKKLAAGGDVDVFGKLIQQNVAPISTPDVLPVPENSPAGTFVGKLKGYDPDGDDVTFKIINDKTGNFSLSSSGDLKINFVADYEAKSSYQLAVVVTETSAELKSDTNIVTVNISNVNEFTPVFTSKVLSIAENSFKGTVVDTIVASDADGDSISYSIIAGNTGNMFIIDPKTGIITLNGSPDFETTPSYALDIKAVDNGSPQKFAVLTYTINVTDVDENQPPVISDQTFSVAENTGIGTVIGTVLGNDPEKGPLTYFISEQTFIFSINPSTGQLSLTGVPDYETQSKYAITVRVTDNKGASNTATVNINVTDLPEGSVNSNFAFDSIAALTYDKGLVIVGTPYTHSNSTVPVQFYSSDTTVAKISSDNIVITGAGSVRISAYQPGNATYANSDTISHILIIDKANQAINNFGPFDPVYDGTGPYKLYATLSSGEVIYYSSSDTSVVSIAGDSIYVNNIGSSEITAYHPGNQNYFPVEQKLTFFVNQPPLIIVGNSIVNQNVPQTYSVNPNIPNYNYFWVNSSTNSLFIGPNNENGATVLYSSNSSNGTLTCFVTKSNGDTVSVLHKSVSINHGVNNAINLGALKCPNEIQSCSGVYINSFSIGNLNNTNSGCSDFGYFDYTPSDVFYTDLLKGDVYEVKATAVKPDSVNTLFYFGLWIDYNNNGSFADADEFITSALLEDSNFVIPNLIIKNNPGQIGPVRLRIRVKQGTSMKQEEACTSQNDIGETEDYVVILKEQDALEAPQVITPNNDGFNDYFVVRGIDANATNKLTVYDRWGNVRFTKSNYKNDWSGMLDDNTMLEPGSYMFVFTNGSKSVKGFIEIRY